MRRLLLLATALAVVSVMAFGCDFGRAEEFVLNDNATDGLLIRRSCSGTLVKVWR